MSEKAQQWSSEGVPGGGGHRGSMNDKAIPRNDRDPLRR